MVANLHDLFQTVRYVNNRNPLSRQFPHDLKKNLYLLLAERGCGLVHDQDLQIISHKISCNFNHLLLTYPQFSHKGLRINFMFQSFQNIFRLFYMSFVIKSDFSYCLLPCHKNILIHIQIGKQT